MTHRVPMFGGLTVPRPLRRAPVEATLDDARDVRSRVLRALEHAELATDERERAAWLRFAIVGGGPIGVELAAQIAALARRTLRSEHRAARVSLLEAGPRLLSGFPEPLRLMAARGLVERGVDVWLRADVVGADDEGLDIAAGVRIPARTVVWATSSRPLSRISQTPPLQPNTSPSD